MLEETSVKNGYDMKRLQRLQLEILLEIRRVCDLRGITFYIMNGTCLGAVRHKGFIPWDDDVDIGMHIKDFERFIQCQNDFQDKFFIQSADTDRDFKLMIARVRMNGTTLIEKSFAHLDIHQGIFVDIYPLFGYPTNKAAAKIRSLESILYRILLSGETPQNHGISVKIVGNALLALYYGEKRKRTVKKLYARLKGEREDSEKVAFLFGMDVSLFYTIEYQRSWFEKPSIVIFEGYEMPAPTDWDSYLRTRYNDYMKLPPKEKRMAHHGYRLVDLDHSYLDYKGTAYCIHKGRSTD